MLVERCRSRKTRRVTFTKDAPVDWRPYEIKDPRAENAYLTDDSAWEFAAEQFESCQQIEEIVLERPPGKKAWALVADGLDGVKIYIKLQLKSERVEARSFHISKLPSKSTS